MKLDSINAAHQFTSLGMWVLSVFDVIREINRMDRGFDPVMAGRFMKDSCRLANICSPLENNRGLQPGYGCRHQHQFLERKGVYAYNWYEPMDNEFGNIPAVYLELAALWIADGIAR